MSYATLLGLQESGVSCPQGLPVGLIDIWALGVLSSNKEVRMGSWLVAAVLWLCGVEGGWLSWPVLCWFWGGVVSIDSDHKSRLPSKCPSSVCHCVPGAKTGTAVFSLSLSFLVPSGQS